MQTLLLRDRYSIERQLGKKGGRETFLARDLVTQKLVVIKLLKFGLDFEWSQLKLFEREAQTLQNISYPAIPKYLDFFELDLSNCKGVALVQSYIKAKSLAEQVKQGRNFTELEIKQLAQKILEILIYLHDRKPPIIHRDIKPSNILLNNRSGNDIGDVYLVDFGSVQNVVAREGGTITIVGTYGYMPPEQFGDRCVAASDLYSLGATLIYLVTGIQPADLPQKEGKIIFEEISNLSLELTTWLRKMTETSLDRRFDSATVALAALTNPLPQSTINLDICKPDDSQINLQSTKEEIKIIIPPIGFKSKLIFPIAVNISLNSFIISWIFIGISGGFFLMALLILPFLVIGVNMLKRILVALFAKQKLVINREKIRLCYQFCCFQHNSPKPTATSEITKIEISNYWRIENSPLEYIIDASPQIKIGAGRNKYKLDNLSKPELTWLANELSNWLNIAITKN